jgi:hypothetical protein
LAERWLPKPKVAGSTPVVRFTMAQRPESATAPVPEEVPLSDEERAARLERLVERLFSPEGLDRDTLARIEQLTGDE